jgi:hypothetical protein
VQILDDKQFEAYLKRFQPIGPEPIPIPPIDRESQRTDSVWNWRGTAATAFFLVLVIVIGSLILRVRNKRVVVSHRTHYVAVAERHAPAEPLTMRSANAWLVAAPSFKAAVDDLAFQSQTSELTQGKQSAVAVLSKEKIRL